MCGQRLPGGSGPCPTSWCQRADRRWSVVFAVGSYEGGLREAIIRYKYRGEWWWGGVFARLLVAYLERWDGWFEDFDGLVAVPAYTGPGSRRRWDPVGEVLGRVGELAGPAWEVLPGVVVKRAETPRMSGRDAATRRRTAARQLRSALAVTEPGAVAGRRLLVVDDVLAEGSTLQEVAGALRQAGAREVAGLVLARASWAGAPRRSAQRPARQ